MFKEFRNFAMRGNVIDLAVGVIIGAAFGKITTSLVNDVLMPPLGLLLGRVDFTELFLPLNGQNYETLAAARTAGAPVIAFGSFINTVIEFLIVAFAVFIMVRQINRLREMNAGPPPAATEKTCTRCLSTIPIQATKCRFCTTDL
ncbi:MAG: large conductance mechanosensitive channel protein MscL [Rhodospirillaceae bacterium]|nr:large conductance mechanosensitive channel protein MscL [Rhodospirillaceae bacterium]